MYSTATTAESLSFGPFTVVPAARSLSREGVRVEVGDRSFDLLTALLQQPNEVLGKRDLLATVWRDVVVDEGSLRFHIANLRKTLGDGIDGVRYIATVAGRGYSFVAPVSRSGERELKPSPVPAAHVDLPSRLSRVAGRAEEQDLVRELLLKTRFVTVVGSGGVGKTTVVIALAHRLAHEFGGDVLFVDLGAIRDSRMVAATVASMLGLAVQNEDAEAAVITQLREHRVLLILDTCEHLIEGVANLCSRLVSVCPQVHLLATSREALRADGEQVFVLPSLPCPPDDPGLTLELAVRFPAAQLFLDRAQANGVMARLEDADAPVIAAICRKLDGVALAIELAAGRVRTYGLRRTAALLDERLSLSWPGRRTAPPRQRTLQATLDWSYELLSQDEQVVLRRLSVFVGYFKFDAALQVATSPDINEDNVYLALESLIDKSLISAHVQGAMMRYRLLDTTRAYALQAFVSNTERGEPAARHALYYHHLLRTTEWPSLLKKSERAPQLAILGNIRAALEWCFGAGGDLEIGGGLAAAAVPVFLGMSILPECYRWCELALSQIRASKRDGLDEMHLQAGLAMSLMFIRDHSDAALNAFQRSLSIAEQRGDVANQMLLFGPLHMFHFRRGEFRTSLHYAKRNAALAEFAADRSARTVAHCLTGISLHCMGELDTARAELETCLQHEPVNYRNRVLLLGFDYYIWAGMALGRTLWLQGHTEQALTRIQASIESAESLDHPVTLSMALHWAAGFYLWTGDVDSAQMHVDWFLSRAKTHSLGPYLEVAKGLQGAIAVRRGEPAQGVELLGNALERLHLARYELVSTSLRLALAEGCVAMNRMAEGLQVIEMAATEVERNGDYCFLPELLRVKAQLLAPLVAEECLRHALTLAHQQSAGGWARRIEADLSALMATREG